MKHLFLVNPAAGKYDQTFDYSEKIHALCTERELNYEIRVSAKAGDLTKFAREAGESGEETRIYACGGDGTLNEVVNGACGFPNLAVTAFPGGSGNDFIKVFSDPAKFRDLSALLDAEEARFDLIDCNGMRAINICSIGLDARIGTEVAKYKRIPGVTGHGAYLMSTVVNLFKGIHEPYTIEVGGEVIEGDRTLLCISSGRFYGGGFNPIPEAEPDDGLLDVLLVEPVTVFKVAQVIGPYKAGKYRNYPKLFRYIRTEEVTVRAPKEIVVNVDGEALRASEITFRIMPGAIRFFYPQGLTYKLSQEEASAEV